MANKPSFRAAFKRRRCLILANGFYEWQTRAKQPKQPYYICLKDRDPSAFEGLWEHWTAPDSGSEVQTCVILTTSSNALMVPLHDQMPVILRPSNYDARLDLDPTYYQRLALKGMF